MPASFFRPIIPLFINWQDYMQQHDKSADLWETLELIIDPRFPYITVNQHDCGNDRLTNSYPNVIVLSSGGYGHIALPLVRGERPAPSIKPQQRARNIFWKGEEAFHHRAKALHVLRQHFNVTPGTKNYEMDLTQHVFGFAGRGHGRTSFRLMELIQSGTIPLYIYDDVPWMPYHPKVDWNRFALSASLTQLDELVRRIKELQANVTATTAMHDFMLARRRSHFTNEGVILQINRLFIDPRPATWSASRCPTGAARTCRPQVPCRPRVAVGGMAHPREHRPLVTRPSPAPFRLTARLVRRTSGPDPSPPSLFAPLIQTRFVS
eukprot:TRINITY_DN6202_c0_g1_i1.p1 TRINITY_DN6202_c0_g1~~TRINITY_DN6202_c0_g1_i1.p1  ORF type:complete len:322 (+),score=78.01 TRINITY_DN6202_c0_g1_i1:637-1602(+)